MQMSENVSDDEILARLFTASPAEVLGMITLDIRRPTYHISNCTELLLKEDLSPEAKTKIIEVIKANSQRIIESVKLAWEYLEQHEGMSNPFKDE
jgi:hypothetical protein